MQLTSAQRASLERNPARFIERTIKDYLTKSPNNRLPAYPDERAWDDFLLGFADGDDPIFREYKTIIGEFHVTPREVLEMYMDSTGCGDKNNLPHVSVISWILPATQLTRESNRREKSICSVRWNNTRFQGQEVIARLSRHLVSMLEDLGYIAVAPDLSRWWEVVRTENGPASKWSQRHIAYAAGLGTFGLSDGFITPKGIAIRAGSIVCNLDLPAAPRRYAHHYANCLFHTRGSCKKCAERCPAGAISEKGHDKTKCASFLNQMREVARNQGRTEGYMGRAYLGCGFCQTGVPCENGIPVED